MLLLCLWLRGCSGCVRAFNKEHWQVIFAGLGIVTAGPPKPLNAMPMEGMKGAAMEAMKGAKSDHSHWLIGA